MVSPPSIAVGPIRHSRLLVSPDAVGEWGWAQGVLEVEGGGIIRQQSNMQKEERRFNSQYNSAIIRLIRQKISPLQRSKKHLFPPPPPKQTKSLHIPNNHISLPSLPSSPQHHLPCEQLHPETAIIDRVKEYLENKRRENNIPDLRVQLSEFIELFEKPQEQRERGKRDSIELNVFEFEGREKVYPKQPSMGYEESSLNDDERSILNAKIRRRLNHKKMIDLCKRY